VTGYYSTIGAKEKMETLFKKRRFSLIQVEFNSFYILKLSLGQVVLSRGIPIVGWVKPVA
jgi:hypothetical protein